jgi:hypothetical protein
MRAFVHAHSHLLGLLICVRSALLETFLSLREVSVEVVEAIVAWRWYEGSAATSTTGGGVPVFMWNGLDYIHKLCNDLDFLSTCERLVC